jgi:hypothetical protein
MPRSFRPHRTRTARFPSRCVPSPHVSPTVVAVCPSSPVHRQDAPPSTHAVHAWQRSHGWRLFTVRADADPPGAGFIIKVKKILESICVNCGKLKADIVSGAFPLYLLRTPPPNFLGALSTVPGEPQTHTASRPRSSRCSPARSPPARVFGRLTAAPVPMARVDGWTRGRVVKRGPSEECETYHVQRRARGQRPRPLCPFGLQGGPRCDAARATCLMLALCRLPTCFSLSFFLWNCHAHYLPAAVRPGRDDIRGR